MSYQRSVILSIDNTYNQYDLVLQSIQGLEGTISPSIAPDYTIPAGTATTTPITISNDSVWHGADVLLVWTTGAGNFDQIFMNLQNALDQVSYPNVAQLSIINVALNPSLYGTSFLYASVGNSALQRDAPPKSSEEGPLTVNAYIVQNAYNNVNPGNYLPGITKVVMLMLENRSLDHLLGQLYTESNPAPNYYPATDPVIPFNGLGDNPTFENQFTDKGGDTYGSLAFPITPSSDPTTPDPDPGEGFEYVNNQLYYPSYDYSQPPQMQGFLYDYYTNAGLTHGGDSWPDASQIMGFYTSGQLPVISGLARQYAISDAWFCSVPSQTYVNRAFSIAGTSSGCVDNGDDPNPPGYMMRTMFNVLMDSGNFNWTIYSQDDYWLDNSFVTFEFDAMDTDVAKSKIANISDFFTALAPGGPGLPAFSYIEPAWYGGNLFNWSGNDYHPTANLLPGEEMLNGIYQALASSPDWNNTLFIVTFDEHGGTMDHVSPPSATQPDPMPYNGNGLSFDFTRLGVRVPTLLISPQIAQGTVFRSPTGNAFDHTSFVRTILGWMGIDVSQGVMGGRAAVAPDFSGVLSGGTVVNPGMINIEPYAQDDAVKEAKADLPLNDLQKQMTYGLAYSLCDGEKGGEEHRRIWNELKQMKSLRELQQYVINAKATRAAKKDVV